MQARWWPYVIEGGGILEKGLIEGTGLHFWGYRRRPASFKPCHLAVHSSRAPLTFPLTLFATLTLACLIRFHVLSFQYVASGTTRDNVYFYDMRKGSLFKMRNFKVEVRSAPILSRVHDTRAS